MLQRQRLTRRAFLRTATVATGAVALAACTQAPAPVPTKPAAALAKPTPELAKPTTAPTVAPSAPASSPGTVATAAPTAASAVAPSSTAPAKAAEPKLGKSLIGRLEGPELVTDPAKLPKSFKEAPMLADLVKAGKLPPVNERVGQDPLVIKPLREIGKYGGQWRRGFTGPADYWNGLRAASGPDHVLFWDYTGDKVVPNVAKSWEQTDGGRATVVGLRRGLKWSDGQPFTADDFLFWFEDMYRNSELNPTPAAMMAINGKQGTLEKVDGYTIRYRFPDPHYLLPDVLAGSTVLGGHSFGGMNAMGSFGPAHYLKQFHPKYAKPDELDKKIKDGKFDNWKNLFRFKNSWHLNPELPAITPWITKTPANTPNWVLERNPYSFWVDSEGNQLPYIDRITMTLAENLEVLNLRAIAGEYDMQARHIDLQKLPIFIENQDKGAYKMYLDPGNNGGDMTMWVNLSYEADPEVAKWMATADFRRALSLGIDRDQINETFWLGTGVTGSMVPAETTPYNPGPEYRTLWSVLDLKQANGLLDKIGLDKKDNEGYRLRTDGKGRLRLEVVTQGGQFVQYTQISEMVREQWKKIGIQLDVVEIERSLAGKRSENNDTQLYAWNNGGSEHLFTYPDTVFTFSPTSSSGQGPLYGRWFQSGGTQGKEPPPRLREIMDKWRRAFGVPEAERIQLGKEIWKIIAEDVNYLCFIAMGPAAVGTRVAKVNMGNIPSRLINSPDAKNPAIAHCETFFWK